MQIAAAGFGTALLAGHARADETPLTFSAMVLTALPGDFFPTMFRAREENSVRGKPMSGVKRERARD